MAGKEPLVPNGKFIVDILGRQCGQPAPDTGRLRMGKKVQQRLLELGKDRRRMRALSIPRFPSEATITE